MHDILQVLRQEHKNITNLINTLEWQVAEFERGNPPDYDVIQATADYFLGFLDLYHHPKEDLIFTKLLERDAGIVKVIGDLSREHAELGARSATSLPACTPCSTSGRYRARHSLNGRVASSSCSGSISKWRKPASFPRPKKRWWRRTGPN